VSGSGLPARVETFIARNIDSIEKLEVLLLLRSRAPAAFSAARVAAELRIAEGSARARLQDLSARGLARPTGSIPDYVYPTGGDPEQDADVAAVADAYAQRRVSVISFIFSNPQDKLRGFADAFRLGGGGGGKKGGDGHG
jgi:hypothetical protein